MQQEEFLEQITNELKTMSEDFNHDENVSKSLVKSILESKPHVQQDPYFKNKVASNLARHIARKKNPVSTPVVSQSRLARLIAYGLPGLTLCFVVWYTLPFRGEDLNKTFETDTTTFQIPLSVENTITETSPTEIVNDQWTELQDSQASTSHETVSDKWAELWGVQDSAGEELPDELLLLLGISPASQNKSTQTNTQQDTPSSQQNPSTTEPEHIPVQTTIPANESSSSQQTVLMKWGETPTTTSAPTTTSVVPTATVQTTPAVSTQEDPQDLISEERKLFAEQLGKLLSVTITVRQGDIVDCLSKEWTLTCDLLANRSFDKEHKSLLLDEIAKNLPSDLIDKVKIMQIKMILGL